MNGNGNHRAVEHGQNAVKQRATAGSGQQPQRHSAQHGNANGERRNACRNRKRLENSGPHGLAAAVRVAKVAHCQLFEKSAVLRRKGLV